MEFGVYRGASVALMIAQVRSWCELRHLVGFLIGETLEDCRCLMNGFGAAAEAIVSKVPTEDLIREVL